TALAARFWSVGPTSTHGRGSSDVMEPPSTRSLTRSSRASNEADSVGVKVRFWRGAWWGAIYHHGPRKMKRIGADRDTAERIRRALREKIARGELNLEPATSTHTLTGYAAAWTRAAKGNLKASTLAFYEAHLERHILPALGTRQVSSLRRSDCRELVAQ